MHDIPSSYRFDEVSRKYRLRLEMQLTAAGEMRQIRQDYSLEIFPPLMDHGGGESSVNGGRNGSVASGQDGPPGYRQEGLPGYGQATAEGAPPPHTEQAVIGTAV